ncbi:putative transmembrane protein [Toxoplasma gondii VEG]|uniref:Transmembrane protein n=4 Tax=Toxoplasma gondii TaxID=5811 RepID=V5BML8_TOXGV|nr:putative transmembrane protein [Toxoplasma gondii VEG]KFG52508.1 putative transmembrane protein [Toxoplasma gondii p89]PUA87674.1 putative transmembrane protein [Toxoplasma gondii TgCATBr9]
MKVVITKTREVGFCFCRRISFFVLVREASRELPASLSLVSWACARSRCGFGGVAVISSHPVTRVKRSLVTAFRLPILRQVSVADSFLRMPTRLALMCCSRGTMLRQTPRSFVFTSVAGMALLLLSSGGSSVPRPPNCISALFPPSVSLSACQRGSLSSAFSRLLRSTSARVSISGSSSQSSINRLPSSLWKKERLTPSNDCHCLDGCLFGDEAPDPASSCSVQHSSCGCEEESGSAGQRLVCGSSRDLNTLQRDSTVQYSKERDKRSLSNDEIASREFEDAVKTRSGIERANRRQAGMYNANFPTNRKIVSTTSRRSQHNADEEGWERASSAWQHRAAPFRVSVYKKEIGGDGDCMYHSIAACLKELEKFYPAFEALDMQAIRNVAADGFVGFRPSETSENRPGPDWDADAFMRRLEVLAALEDEEWLDPWSPSAVLSGDQYRNSDYIIMDTSTPEGKAAAVHFELSRPGSVHWGSGFDIDVVEDALNIGVVVLSHETGGVYARASRTDVKRPYYILIYYYSGQHFQQAGIRHHDKGSGSMEIRSAFSADEVPDFVLRLHREDCRQPLFPEADEGKQ